MQSTNHTHKSFLPSAFSLKHQVLSQCLRCFKRAWPIILQNKSRKALPLPVLHQKKPSVSSQNLAIQWQRETNTNTLVVRQEGKPGQLGHGRMHDDRNQHLGAVCSERVPARCAAVLTELFLLNAPCSSQHVCRTPSDDLVRLWGLKWAVRLKANWSIFNLTVENSPQTEWEGGGAYRKSKQLLFCKTPLCPHSSCLVLSEYQHWSRENT